MNAEAVHRIFRRCYRLVVVVLTCTVLACDTDVDRFTDRSGGVAFNLTGVITTESDTQFVRVQRIREEIVQTSADPLKADVTLTDLDTGESRRLLDSLVVLDNGERDHLFFTPYVVTAGHRYQLMVEGVDGDVATATTTVPDRPSTTVVRADIFGSLITQSVSWNALTRTPEHAVVTYEIARSQED
ncbi:MAG: DUF4249 family protein, partial [Rhodothermales bacterium]|nr:DUF4249 family protein [Rhodothermales bacterium]